MLWAAFFKLISSMWAEAARLASRSKAPFARYFWCSVARGAEEAAEARTSKPVGCSLTTAPREVEEESAVGPRAEEFPLAVALREEEEDVTGGERWWPSVACRWEVERAPG